MGKKIRLLFLLIGLSLFIYLVSHLGIDNIIINIGKVGWWFVPVLAVWGVGYVLNTLSWRMVLGVEGRGIKFLKLLKITLSSFALNYTTPFMTLGGEPFRALAIQEQLGIRRAMSSVILYRMIHTLAQIIFWMIAIIIVFATFPVSMLLKQYLAVAFCVMLIGIYFFWAIHKKGFLERLVNILAFLPPTKGLAGKLQKQQAAILEMDGTIRELYNSRKSAFYGALSIELAFRFLISVEFYFIMHAVGNKITLLDSLYISAAISLMTNLVFFVPYEVGIREGSLYLIMESLKFTPEIGIFVSLVNRIREIFWTMIGLSLIYFTGDSQKRRDLKSEIKEKII